MSPAAVDVQDRPSRGGERRRRAAAAVDVLLREAPPILAASVDESCRCILAARLVVDVLGRLDVPVVPIPVSVAAANRWAVALAEKRIAFDEAVRLGASVVMTETSVVRPGRYPAHLVCYVPDLRLVVDLDAQQFARPARAIYVPPATRFRANARVLRGEEVVDLALPDDGVLSYSRIVAPLADYREAPNWRAPNRAMLALAAALAEAARDRPAAG